MHINYNAKGETMKKSYEDADATQWRVIDRDTGEEINHVVRADDETGEYEVHVIGDDGLPETVGKLNPRVKTEIRKGNIRLERITPEQAKDFT